MVVSGAPLAKFEAYKAKNGWGQTVPRLLSGCVRVRISDAMAAYRTLATPIAALAEATVAVSSASPQA